MNVFIYDYFVNEKRYNRDIIKLETRMTDLGLNGRIYRVGVNQNIGNLIAGEIDRTAKTIILVGDDSTFSRSLDAIAEKKIPAAIIPIGKTNQIARSLGVSNVEEACNILASRRMEIIDLGQANGSLFINKASISTDKTSINIDSDYSIEVGGEGSINVINLPIEEDNHLFRHSPNDSRMELVIATKEGSAFKKQDSLTLLPFNNITVTNDNNTLILDGSKTIKCPVEIKISNKKLNMIVGKGRMF